jgi:signal transduction histidine kinase/HD-like signal output (HDOD) protein
VTVSADDNGGSEGRLSHQRLELLLRGLECLPSEPAAVCRLLGSACAAARGEAGAADIAAVAAADPGIAAWLMRRAADETGTPSDGLAGAIAAMDGEALVAAALCPPLPVEPPRDGAFDLHAFREHAVACAVAARALAERVTPPADGDLAYTRGLLHDVGKLALWSLLPKSYERVLDEAAFRPGGVAEIEWSIIGADHAAVGRRLAEVWGLGETLAQVIGLHHQPLGTIVATPEEARMAAIVIVADSLCGREGIGCSGDSGPSLSPAECADALGIEPRDIEEVADELAAEVAEIVGPAADDKAHSNASLIPALRAANVELARMNRRLRGDDGPSNRELAELRVLLSGLAGADSVPDVLAAILQAAGAATGEATFAYSRDVRAREVLFASVEGGGGTKLRVLAQGEAAAILHAPDAGALSGEDVESLISTLDRPRDAREYAHAPLVASGRWVGGVIRPGACECVFRGRAASLSQAAGELAAMVLAAARALADASAGRDAMLAAARRAADAQTARTAREVQAAVASLAAGAAHEMNTPLAVISGRAQLMRHKAASDNERTVWQLIVDRSQQIADMLADLAALASPDEPRTEAIPPGELISRAVEELRRSGDPQAASVKVDIETGEGLPAIRADRRQAVEALLAVLANAAAASGPEGKVTVRALADPRDENVVISVADAGKGMDDETLKQAFTPFVSKQRAGRRRGMGLPKAKRFVENNGGTIRIDSQAGKGTRVFLQLPAG